MSDAPVEPVTIRIDYGDGSEVEEHVVTPGFFHFHPAVDEEKRIPTVTVVGDDNDDDEPEEEFDNDDYDDEDEIEDADVVEDDEAQPEQPSAPAGFDPTAHTVQDVKDYVTANPGEAQAVLDLEVASQNRVTLVSWLESFTNQ